MARASSPPHTAPAGAEPVFGLAMGGLLAMAAALGIGRFVYTPILPNMLEGLDLSKADGGLIASANFLGYLLGALAAALAGLPGHRRTWLLGALAVSAITTGLMALPGLMALTESMALFVLLRFSGGMASALVLVFASSLVLERLAGVNRPGLSAVHFAGVGAGIAFSAFLIAGLTWLGYGWQSQWLAAGAVSLAALLAVAWLVPARPDSLPAPGPALRSPGLNHGLLVLAVAYGLFGFGYVITATFISTMVRTAPNLEPIEPFVWPLVGLAAVPSVAGWTWAGRRIGNLRSFALACGVEAAGVSLSLLTRHPTAVLAAAVLIGGTFMGLTALGLIHARELSRGDPRRSLALMTGAFGLGQMIGPAFAGVVYQATDSLVMPSLAASAALVVAAVIVMILRGGSGTVSHSRQPPPPGAAARSA